MLQFLVQGSWFPPPPGYGETSPKRSARRRARFVFKVPVHGSEFEVHGSVAPGHRSKLKPAWNIEP
jgi:hypothetical protein